METVKDVAGIIGGVLLGSIVALYTVAIVSLPVVVSFAAVKYLFN